MPDNTAIKVDHVSKEFKLPHEKQTSIKGALINLAHTGKKNRSYERQQVLKDVSFEVKEGEFFGIVGRNGSGKSTLLKMLAGIYTPTKGHVQVKGKLTPFIELGVGFNQELTGRENVFLNGALLGFNRSEMLKMYDDIVGFAELDKFMDQKLKNYSSGMQVRLAFSIAIRAESDILLIDEVLAVGDENFQRKCFDYFYKLKREKRTVILVTHDMNAVRNFCDRAILLQQGIIQKTGEPSKIAHDYSAINISSRNSGQLAVNRLGNQKVEIISCRAVYPSSKHAYGPRDNIQIELKLRSKEVIRSPVLGITLKDQAGREIFVTNTKTLGITTQDIRVDQDYFAKFILPNNLTDGTYLIAPAITNTETTELYDSFEDGCEVVISGWPYPTGVMQLAVKYNMGEL